jgi:hypothetical protein
MTHEIPIDFSALYRAAFAERDPQRKQILLSQVQKLISNTLQEEGVPLSRIGVQSVSLPKISAVA